MSPTFASLSIRNYRIYALGGELDEHPAPVLRVVVPLDEAVVGEAADRAGHARGRDLFDVGQGARGERPVLEPRQDRELVRRNGVGALEADPPTDPHAREAQVLAQAADGLVAHLVTGHGSPFARQNTLAQLITCAN